MNEIDDVSATIKRMLLQSFEDGRRQGQQEVRDAVRTTLRELGANMIVSDVPEIELEPKAPEPKVLKPKKRSLSPFRARVLDYVNANPGATATGIRHVVGGSTATIYKLQEAGLVTKVGTQFYPPETGAQ